MKKRLDSVGPVPKDAFGVIPDEVVLLSNAGTKLKVSCENCGKILSMKKIECVVMVSKWVIRPYLKITHKCRKGKS